MLYSPTVHQPVTLLANFRQGEHDPQEIANAEPSIAPSLYAALALCANTPGDETPVHTTKAPMAASAAPELLRHKAHRSSRGREYWRSLGTGRRDGMAANG